MAQNQDIQYRKETIRLLEENNQKDLTDLLDSMSSKEIVHLLGHLKRDDQLRLLTILDPENAAEVLEEIPEAQAVEIIEELSDKDAAAILDEMESDEQADIIKELDEEDANAILHEMDPEEAADVRKRIEYEDDIAGGLMRTEYLAFDEHLTVEAITESLRTQSEEFTNYALKYIFVVTRAGVLSGVLQMHDLLLASGSTPLSKIILRDVKYVDHKVSFDDLYDFFHENEWLGVPVVDDNKKLVGVVLRRDILEVETERLSQEQLERQGIVGGEELRSMPLFSRAKNRLSWLSINVLLNIVAASVIAYHQDVLGSVIALAVFLPIISDMSGCSGNQAVAVSMRELSLGAVKPVEVLRVLWQELGVGIINGIALGFLIGAAAWLWKGNIYLGLVVGGALALNTLVAVAIGGTVPLLLKGRNIDPALASGPILTTITDMFGFFLALTFASLALNQIGGI